MIEFTLNGTSKQYDGDPKQSLLTYLRDTENLISLKDGCVPEGTCGCCLVEIDGRGVLACRTAMRALAGKSVTTLEGIDEDQKRLLANAFVEKGGVQCGFCIPGIVMHSHILLRKKPNPTRADVQQMLERHLCRCTGYKKIEEAILHAAEARREQHPIDAPFPEGLVGTRQPKYEAYQLALGQRPFVADLKVVGMLHGALRFSDHPRARVVAIHTEKAAQLPGVVRIVTAKDIPGQRHTGLIVSDWPLMIDVGEETRYVGDVIAGVVARSEAIARQAADMIDIEYEVLPPLTNPRQALAEDSPRLHADGNLLSETIIRRGHTDNAFDNAAYLSHGTYQTQRIEHGFMEPECCLARPQDNGLEIYSQGQGVYEDQKQIARLLDLPEELVNVVLVPNGGGFGGKEDLSVQGHAALYAHLLHQPVRVSLTRAESIRMHPKRHPIEMEYRLACDANGQLTALKARILGDTGAYASVGMKVLERAAGHATGAYFVPNVDIVSRAVYTNNIPCGAMRGFGVNQVTFALESCIDDLCQQGGFDRWQFRYDNALRDGQTCTTGQIIKGGCGARETLLAVKDHFQQAKYAGIACGIKNTGIGNGMPDEGEVKIEIVRAEKIVVHHGWTEMGQGVNTMAVQFVSQETGLDPDLIEVRVETAAKARAGMTTASRATSILGNAILNACRKLRTDLELTPLTDLVGQTYTGSWRCDWTTALEAEVDEIITHYSYSYAAQVVILDDAGKIAKVYAAHDAGRIINPTLFEGQIQGSVHMGLGYALSEDLPLDDGVPRHTKLGKLGILRAKETPDIEVIGVEVPDPHGPYGAKGVGEIGLVPTAAAVANAFCQFDGARRYRLPLAPIEN